jgi:chemotaxis protein CheD
VQKRAREVTLDPGQWLFGRGDLRIHTILGSCVAATFWHPRLLIGGMCHYLLPERASRDESPRGDLDGKYGTEALHLLLREMVRLETNAREYVVKLFGGGDMFPGRTQGSDWHIGARNAAHGRQLLIKMGYTIAVENVTGAGYRSLYFDVPTGDVWMKFRAVDQTVRHVQI